MQPILLIIMETQLTRCAFGRCDQVHSAVQVLCIQFDDDYNNDDACRWATMTSQQHLTLHTPTMTTTTTRKPS